MKKITVYTTLIYVVCFLIGLMVSNSIHNHILKSVGIKDIKLCSIHTTNCESNWWEIVWIDKSKLKEVNNDK